MGVADSRLITYLTLGDHTRTQCGIPDGRQVPTGGRTVGTWPITKQARTALERRYPGPNQEASPDMTGIVRPDSGGYLNGPQVDPPGQIVDFAQLAVQMFAGDGPLSRADVLDLIGHWYRNAEMSDDDVRALLDRYPPAPITRGPQS